MFNERSSMGPKEQFMNLWEWECGTTLKVLKALPEDQVDFRPHERSRSALELGWALAVEQILFKQFAEGKPDFSVYSQPPPGIWEAVLDTFQKNHAQSKKAMEALSDEDFQKGALKLPWRDATKADAIMTFMHDMIHHRGQFSVYLRLAGGKVPAIYGPSADDPGQ